MQMNPWAFVSTGCRVCSVGTDSSGAGEEAGRKDQHTEPGRQLVSEIAGPQELIWLGPGHRNEMPKLQNYQEKEAFLWEDREPFSSWVPDRQQGSTIDP